MFGVVFPNHSYPLDPSSFTQIDQTHWVLDITTTPAPRQVCLFLLAPTSLPADKALSLYVQPNSAHSYAFCGAVSLARPSALLRLPEDAAKIGLSVEDSASLPALDSAAEARAERVALRVGENLFNFMQSFCGAEGSRLVVPMDILDRWFNKFRDRARRDPGFLTSFDL